MPADPPPPQPPATAARELLCDRCRPLVQHWLRRRWRNTALRTQIDDATQDVFVACLQPGGPFDPRSTPPERHELPGILRRVVEDTADILERRYADERRHCRCLEVALARPLPDGADAPIQLDRRWLRGCLEQAVRSLAPRHPLATIEHSAGEFLSLHLEQGLPVREIARRWRLRSDQVHELRRRAMRRLRAALLRMLGSSPDLQVRDLDEARRELLALLA